jgi:hypothetical protein
MVKAGISAIVTAFERIPSPAYRSATRRDSDSIAAFVTE